ncbi:MAG: DedA family protein [Mycobacterium leprae]
MGAAAHYLYEHFGLAGAGLVFMLEGLGVPIPVEIPLLIIGAREQSSYWSLVLLTWFSTMLGNGAGYLIGYHGGRTFILRLIGWFRVKPETWQRAENWFHKHGLKTVVATRWINWGFAQNMWLCGITRVQAGRFFIVMAANDFLWAIWWTWVARFAVERFRRRSPHFLFHSSMRVTLIALAVALVGLTIILVFRRWQKRRSVPNQ